MNAVMSIVYGIRLTLVQMTIYEDNTDGLDRISLYTLLALLHTFFLTAPTTSGESGRVGPDKMS